MTQIIDTSNADDISAFITAALISHTNKVESTRSIVDIWDDLRKNLEVENNLDFLSVLLGLGRLLDIKEQLSELKFIEMLNEISKSILKDLEKRGHEPDINDTKFITAMISSACISRSEGIETVNEIIEKWEEINREIIIETDLDILAAVLTIGKIIENRYELEDVFEIVKIYNQIKEHLFEFFDEREVEQIHIAAAFLANAYIEVEQKVERIQAIIIYWLEVQKELVVDDKIDYISSILTYGRIRDLNSQFHLAGTSIADIKNSVRKFIEQKN